MLQKNFLGIFCLIFSLFTILNSCQSSTSQNERTEKVLLPEMFYKHFAGNLNEKIKIRMNLQANGKFLQGYYFYESVGAIIFISGELLPENKVKLIEFNSKNDTTGIFSGQFLTNNKLIGKWTNPKRTKTFNFELNEDYSQSVEFQCFKQNKRQLLNEPDTTPYANINLFYLHPSNFAKKDVLTKIQKQIATNFFTDIVVIPEKPNENINKFIEKYCAEYKVWGKEFDPGMENFVYIWTREVTSSILYNDDKILSVAADFYEYSGGAHPNSSLSYRTFNLETGDIFQLSDIFSPNFEEKLTEKIFEKLRQRSEAKTNEELTEQGFFTENIKPINNFYLDKAGIGFCFNAYEIAPYVVGAFLIYIPFSEIKPILKKEFLTKFNIR